MTEKGDDLGALSVLVDWDNLERSFKGRNIAEDVAFALRERVAALARDRFPSVREVEVRCYSAWLEPSGAPTRVAQAVRSKIEGASAFVQGLSVRLECVDQMAVQGAPSIFAHLVGPRECRCPARGEIYEQKMVDTLIVVDAAALAEYDYIALAVVGDDVDLAPGLAMAGVQRAYVTKRPTSADEVVWLRRRPQTRQTRLLADLLTIEDW